MKSIYEQLFSGNKGLLILLDPDRMHVREIPELVKFVSLNHSVLGFLVGTSILMTPVLDQFVETLKTNTDLPVILFPGSAIQITPKADALLYLIMVSGRNPELLIGEHVRAAPLIQYYQIEAISTAYILIESGTFTSVEYMSHTRPLPREKPEIALAHALAAKLMGVKVIYLEGGSGAQKPIPRETISLIKKETNLPTIVGGGYRSKENIIEAFEAGADIVVIGSAIEQNHEIIRELNLF